MEIVAVTLIVVLLFQWFQWPSSQQAQTPEPTPLITVPEPLPNGERVRLLLDEEMPAPEDEGEMTSPPTPEVAVTPEEAIPAEGVEAIPNGTVEPIAPSPIEPPSTVPALIPQNTPRPSARRDEVWALLDQAAAEGVEGYSALMAYVKDKSGQGTSRSTVKAWKEARAEVVHG